MTLTATDIDRRLRDMEIRASSTGKLHLFPDDRNDPPRGHPEDGVRYVRFTHCGLTEDRLSDPDCYQRPAADWDKPALVPANRRCLRCAKNWQARLDLAR
jgi:hypothetical protein